MSESIDRCVAYRCPKCGTGVMGPADIMKLPGREFRLNCTCGKSTMTIDKDGSGKLTLHVPCVMCGRPHTFTLQGSLWESPETVALPCPYSGLNICFVGEINRVKAALAESELKILNTMQELGIDSFEAFHPGEGDEGTEPGGPEAENEVAVMQVLEQLVEERKVRCHCPDGMDGEFEVTATDGALEIECTICHARRTIPLDNGPALQAFLETDELFLE